MRCQKCIQVFNVWKDGGSEYSEPIPFRTEKYLPVPNIRKDGGSEYSEGGSSLKSWCTRIMPPGTTCPSKIQPSDGG